MKMRDYRKSRMQRSVLMILGHELCLILGINMKNKGDCRKSERQLPICARGRI
jgi:hypothetical protein